MTPQQKLQKAHARLFVRSAVVAGAGIFFFHAHLFLGFVQDPFVLKVVAVLFFLSAIPLPILVIGQRKLFPGLKGGWKSLLKVASVALLVHHFLMAFIFVLILDGGAVL